MALIAEEEARVEAYLDARANRLAACRAREAAMRGSSAAAEAVRLAWEPLVLAIRAYRVTYRIDPDDEGCGCDAT